MSATVYLSGPMRGYKDFNFPAFMEAASALRAQGYWVYNPAERDVEHYGEDAFRSETGDLADVTVDFDIRYSLAEDVEMIAAEMDAVVALPGWIHSKGAVAEVATARAVGIDVYEWFGGQLVHLPVPGTRVVTL